MSIEITESQRKLADEKLDLCFRILARIIVRQIIRNETPNMFDEASNFSEKKQKVI